MNGRYTLTLGELRLIQAVVGKSPVIGGLEEFALSEQTKPELRDRQGLAEKGILVKNDKDRFEMDKVAGYVFSTLAQSPACLRGQLLWPTGEAARFNIYLLDTAFLVVFCGDLNKIRFVWVPAIPPLIGSMLALFHNQADYRKRTVMTEKDFSEASMRLPQRMLKDAEALGIEPAAAITFETGGTMFGWAGKRFLYLLDGEGSVYCAEPKAGQDPEYQKMTEVKALTSINSQILTIHMAAIQMANETEGEARA